MRARALEAERQAGASRHALEAKSAEAAALQREVKRLRKRAEAAEARLAGLGGGGPLPSQQARAEGVRGEMLSDLHARMRASDERALKGETLVAKLRAFVVQQQEERAAVLLERMHSEREAALESKRSSPELQK